MRNVLTILACTAVLSAAAQKKIQYEVNVGERVMDVINNTQAYHYNAFKQGTLSLSTGQTASSPLNYHALFNEMHFISSKGDTLAIADGTTVNYIAVEADTFYYNDGFALQLAGAKDVKLVKKEIINLSEKMRNTGSYGYTSSSGNESMYGVASAKIFKTLVASEKMVFTRESSLFFRDKDEQFFPVNKNNLLKIYKSQKKAVEQYLSANDVNFNKEEDLKKLMTFLSGL